MIGWVPNRQCKDWTPCTDQLPGLYALPMQTLFLLPWAFATLLLGAFFGVGAYGWPGEFVGAGSMFCEAFAGSWIRQPVNTWSNLGFVVAGLWMVTHISRVSGHATVNNNAFTSSLSLPVLYAGLVIFIGPGSMALHGTGHAWGHALDVLAMFTFIMFPIAWSLVRLAGGGERAFWIVYMALTLPLAVAHVAHLLPFSGVVLYSALIPMAVVLEVIRYFKRPAGGHSLALTLAALGCFALAFAAWRLSLTGAPLCVPESLLQGHAVWHLLCAVATVFLFLAYMRERHRALS